MYVSYIKWTSVVLCRIFILKSGSPSGYEEYHETPFRTSITANYQLIKTFLVIVFTVYEPFERYTYCLNSVCYINDKCINHVMYADDSCYAVFTWYVLCMHMAKRTISYLIHWNLTVLFSNQRGTTCIALWLQLAPYSQVMRCMYQKTILGHCTWMSNLLYWKSLYCSFLWLIFKKSTFSKVRVAFNINASTWTLFFRFNY